MEPGGMAWFASLMSSTRTWRRRFFFSSRRRHTRLTCDWSSDVCSSDLEELLGVRGVLGEDADAHGRLDLELRLGDAERRLERGGDALGGRGGQDRKSVV